jgi:RNA polymerase sigma-70 factor (ECF subfamily)
LPSEEARDEAWHDALVKRYSDPIKKMLARKLNGDHHAAEELLQETFLTAWLKRHDLTEDPIRWLYVTANLHLENHRRYKRRRPTVDLGAVEIPVRYAAPAADQTDHLDLRKALAKLSEKDRQIIDFRYYACMTDEQIAALLDLTEATVRKRVSRALSRARALLPADWDPDARG